jgi:hypothetical protein
MTSSEEVCKNNEMGEREGEREGEGERDRLQKERKTEKRAKL